MLKVSTYPVRMVALFVGMLAMLVATIAFPSTASGQTTGRVVIPVTGELENGETFQGRIVKPDVIYRAANDTLRITGTLVYRNAGERVTQEFNTGILVHQDPDNCRILILNIGRIHLDLLGLVVDIDPIRIDVTAVPGAGNLLGNLLCAIAGLLDPNSALADFLDDLLGTLFTRT